jgi:hypothetical protein
MGQLLRKCDASEPGTKIFIFFHSQHPPPICNPDFVSQSRLSDSRLARLRNRVHPQNIHSSTQLQSFFGVRAIEIYLCGNELTIDVEYSLVCYADIEIKKLIFKSACHKKPYILDFTDY